MLFEAFHQYILKTQIFQFLFYFPVKEKKIENFPFFLNQFSRLVSF